MAKAIGTVEILIIAKISLWSAIKVRIMGKKAELILVEFRKRLLDGMPAKLDGTNELV